MMLTHYNDFWPQKLTLWVSFWAQKLTFWAGDTLCENYHHETGCHAIPLTAELARQIHKAQWSKQKKPLVALDTVGPFQLVHMYKLSSY